MEYLVATDSVHTTAAACDYLVPRLDPDDAVRVLTVAAPGDRDAGDAANVAGARLTGLATVETVSRDGPVAEVILDEARGVDVVVMGAHGGAPGAGPGLGETARAVLEGVDVPVVVVPLPDLA